MNPGPDKMDLFTGLQIHPCLPPSLHSRCSYLSNILPSEPKALDLLGEPPLVLRPPPPRSLFPSTVSSTEKLAPEIGPQSTTAFVPRSVHT